MKYKVNDEGVAALKKMGTEITNAIERIAGEINNTKVFVGEYEKTIDPHGATIISALNGITACVKSSVDSAMEVSTKLFEIADDYQEEIDDDPYVRSIGARTR